MPKPTRLISRHLFLLVSVFFLPLSIMAQIPVIKSVLYVGDSITKHGPAENLGWKHNWGMAATTESNDYVRQFSAKLAKAQGFEVESIVHGVGGGTISGKLAVADSLVKIKADLIVIQLGENDRDVSLEGFEKPYEKLVKLLKEANPSSKIVCLATWSPPSGSPAKDRLIKNVCARNKIPFADLSEANADPKGLAKSTGLWEHPGVGWHPSDHGMAGYAEALWKALNLGDKAIPTEAPLEVVQSSKGPVFTESFEVKETSQLKWKPAVGVLEAGEKGQGLNLTVTDKAKPFYLRYEVSADAIKGKTMVLSARVRADNLSAKDKGYHGVKLGFDFLDAEGHKDYPQAACDTGTFGWKTIRLELRIPDNIIKASILIGLEQVTGTVVFDEIVLEEAGSIPATPAAAASGTVFQDWSFEGLKELPANAGHFAQPDQAKFSIRNLPDLAGPFGKGAIEINIVQTSARANDSDLQFFLLSTKELVKGDSYKVTFWAKTSEPDTFRTSLLQANSPWGPAGDPSYLAHNSAAEWKTYTHTFKSLVSGTGSVRMPYFVLGKMKTGNVIQIGKIKVEKL